MAKANTETVASNKRGVADIGGIPVYCRYDEAVDIDRVTGHPRNPNKHGDEQIALLAKIIKTSGWRNPICVSNRSGFVIKGHGRLMAARVLGVTHVPVEYQDYATEAEEYQDMIADNRIAELAERDMGIIKELLEELEKGANDMDLTGYVEAEIERLMTQFHVEPFGDTSTERDGQGVGSTWESCKKTGAAPVRIGPMETRLTVETAQRICHECNRQFETKGTPINETLEELMLCALRS